MIPGMRVIARMIVGIVAACVACSSKKEHEPEQHPDLPKPTVDAALYSDEAPFDAIELDAPIVETGAVTLALPMHKGSASRDGALAIAQVPNGWREVDVAALTIEGANVTIPAGDPAAIADIASRAGAAGVLLLVGAATPFDDVRELAFALHRECWTFATIDGGAITATWSNPCPSTTPEGKDIPQVAIVIARGIVDVGVTTPRELVPLDPDQVAAKLRAIRTTPAFAKRTDLVFTTLDGVTVGDVVSTVATMHASGFTGARWVPKEWIPMSFPRGAGFEPPPPRPIPGFGVATPPSTVNVTVKDVVARGAVTLDEVSRVIRTRAGIYRACYQKELNRKPGLAGTLASSFEIDATGVVTALTHRGGSMKHDAVRQCIKSNLMRLRFPPRGKTLVKLTLVFASA